MNKVFLCGHVGKDPELRVAGSTNMVSLSVATTSRIKKGEEWVDKTEWHNVIFWGKTAEYVAKTASKGDVVTVSGEINYRKFNNKDGVEKNVTEIKADMDWPMIAKRVKSGSGGDTTTPPPASQEGPDNDLPF